MTYFERLKDSDDRFLAMLMTRCYVEGYLSGIESTEEYPEPISVEDVTDAVKTDEGKAAFYEYLKYLRSEYKENE